MKTTTINIGDMNLDGKEVVVNFNVTYHLPISWLAEENGTIKMYEKDSNFNKLVINYFESQMFNDCFGKIPAESYSLSSLNGYDDIQKEINNRIAEAVAEQKKKDEEEKKLLEKNKEKEKKERIKRLKKELEELEKSVG